MYTLYELTICLVIVRLILKSPENLDLLLLPTKQQTAAIIAAAKQPTKISTLRQTSNLDPSRYQDKRRHGLEVVRRQGPGVGRDQ